jgi:hypothetical protein
VIPIDATSEKQEWKIKEFGVPCQMTVAYFEFNED